LKGQAMSCEHLICARCAGPVVDGRCPTCRLTRAQVHHHGSGLPPAVVLAGLLLMLTLALALAVQSWS
jgi:hypothetical protein